MRVIALALALAASAACAPAAATTFFFEATLNGASEEPANFSPGFGFAKVAYNDAAQTMTLDVVFQDLIGTTIASHIHGPTAFAGQGTTGVATTTPTFPDFPLGVTAGTYLRTFDMTLASSYNPTFLNNAINAGSTTTASATLLAAMKDGKSYLNVHTVEFPGGEIRGFLTAVPEPQTWALMILGFGMAGATLRRRAAARLEVR